MKKAPMKTRERLLKIAQSALALLVSFALLGNPLSAPFYAAAEPSADAAYTDAAPYPEGAIVLYTADDLLNLAKLCSLDSFSVGKKVCLAQNIDLTGIAFSGIPYFAGEFDGAGHAVSGVEITSGGSTCGFFRYVAEGAVVKNLTVRAGVIPSGTKNTLGGIVADNSGTISACNFNGKVNGKSTVGGIAGINRTSGQIVGCASWGTVTGEYSTGGICGKNAGSLVNCTNNARVNTVEIEVTLDISDFDLRTLSDTDTAMVCTDTGGIAGTSSGVIRACTNRATVGYPHTGYNVGGIAGRQSGYMDACVNYGTVYGRKEVAGIVGQAEPYILLSYNSSILNDVFDELDNLQGLLSGTLDHNADLPTEISDRLSAMNDSVSGIKDTTHELIEAVTDWGDESIDTVNDILSRVSFVIDGISPAVTDMHIALNKLSRACDYLDNALVDGKESIRIITDSEELEKTFESLKAVSSAAETALDDISKALEKMERSLGDADAVEEALDDISDALRRLSDAIGGISTSLGRIADRMELPSPEELFPSDEFPYIDLSVITDNFTAFKKELSALSKYLNRVGTSTSLMLEGLSVVTGELNPTEFKASLALLSAAFDTLAGTSDDIQSAFDSMEALVGDFKEAGGALSDAADDMRDVTGQFKGAFDYFAKASDRLKSTADELSAMPDLAFPKIGEQISDSSDAIREDMTAVQDSLSALNQTVADASDTLIDDLRAINSKIGDITGLLRKATDDAAEEKDMDDVYEDISESDTENSSATGKINRCINRGTIEGDVNVGGIAGAMSIESDFDPEDDLQISGSRSLDFIYRTRTVLRSCENDGDITSKKNGVGAIVGRMDIGTVIDCAGYGSVTSTGGDYVGGIAGISYTSITKSRVNCALSGRRYVGGIAGMGHDIRDCISLAAVTKAEESIGAIAGNADGTVKNCGFSSDVLAGIDGISYAGKAEPIDKETLYAEQDILPTELLGGAVVFRADGITVARVPFVYGEVLTDAKIPAVPVKDGYEGKWTYAGEPLTYSHDIEAEYTPYVTAVQAVGAAEVPAILIEGSFGTDIYAQAEILDRVSGLPEGSKAFRVTLSGTEHGLDGYKIRVKTPENKYGIAVYRFDGDAFAECASQSDGSFTVFEASGETVTFALVKNDLLSEFRGTALVGGVLILLILLLILRKIHKKKKEKRAKRRAAHNADDAVPNGNADAEASQKKDE
ncbi:MAG: hypothetical protein ACI4RV_02225 [Eubacteriales bacterium]